MPTIADKPPPKRERALDEALDDSFPASDPPSISPQTTIRRDDEAGAPPEPSRPAGVDKPANNSR